MSTPDEFNRNRKMYAYIIRVLEDGESVTGNFLRALQRSNNSHIIKYIKDELEKLLQQRQRRAKNHSSATSTTLASSSSSSMETKIEILTQHLKKVDLKQFLRSHLVYLCENTKNLKAFILSLHQIEFISQVETDALSRLSDFDACTEIYKVAGKTGYGDKLIMALESSENGHIIQEMYKWINN